MFNIIVIGSTVVACIFGVLLIIKGVKQKIDDLDAVPISQFNEINENTEEKVEKIQAQDELIQEFKKEEAEAAVKEDVKEAVKGPDTQTTAETSDKQDALKQNLEDSLDKLEKTEHTAENLMEENATLKETIDQLKEDNNKLNAQLQEQSNAEIDQGQVDDMKAKFQEELDRIKGENQKLLAGSGEIGALKDQLAKTQNREQAYLDKISSLEEQLFQYTQNDKTAEKIEEKYKVEIQDLRLEMRRTAEERNKLKEELDKARKDFNDQLDRAKETIQSLKEGLSPREEKGESGGEEKSQFPVVELQNENKRLVKDKVGLEKSIDELKEYNNRLIEKERILSYELSKSRAHNLGLEKICEDFKEQIERLSAFVPE